MSLAKSLLLSTVAALVLGSAAFGAEIEIIVFRLDPLSQASCADQVAEFLTTNKIPLDSPQAKAIHVQICEAGAQSVLLMKAPPAEAAPAEAPKKRLLTFDVTGSLAQGNQNNSNLGGNIHYAEEYERAKIDLVFKGEYRMESSGNTYHSFQANGDFEHMINGQWSILAVGSLGRDTRKEIAFTASELGGVALNVFETQSPRSLKFSMTAGHRFESLMDGTFAQDAAGQPIPNNTAIMAYRARYEEELMKDSLSMIAAVWFQHILYAPGSGTRAARVFDVSDYRVLADLQFRLKIANLGNGVTSYATLGGTYEYLVTTSAESNYDLLLKAGMGLSF